MTIQLTVAGIRIRVDLDSFDIGFAANFSPFKVDGNSQSSDLTITYSSKVYKSPHGILPIPAQRGQNIFLEKDDCFYFLRNGGTFKSTKDFSDCRISPPEGNHGEIPQKPLYGLPWILLSIWGYLSLHNGALLHGAIVSIDGKYVMFLGNPEVGKSTLSQLAHEEGHSILTDENPALTFDNNHPIAHATPWPGIRGEARPSAPLHAIFFLRHHSTNTLRKLSQHEASRRLMQNVRPFNWLPTTIPSTLDLLQQTILKVPVYDFGFFPDKKAVDAIKSVL